MAKASFDPQEFRSALSTFTTGVTIITTRAENGDPVGITANSFNSVSLNPPMVLWSLDKSAMSLPSFTNNKHWNVHILSSEQEALSGRFASRGENNIPLLRNCTARFNCRTAFIYEGGDHMIFVGEVLGFDKTDLPPLAFQSGLYALAARKPREGVQLSAAPTPECSYTEDLLGYLAGRAHFQMVATLQNVLKSQQLNEQQFFILSVLSIQDSLTLEEINQFVEYTGGAISAAGGRGRLCPCDVRPRRDEPQRHRHAPQLPECGAVVPEGGRPQQRRRDGGMHVGPGYVGAGLE